MPAPTYVAPAPPTVPTTPPPVALETALGGAAHLAAHILLAGACWTGGWLLVWNVAPAAGQLGLSWGCGAVGLAGVCALGGVAALVPCGEAVARLLARIQHWRVTAGETRADGDARRYLVWGYGEKVLRAPRPARPPHSYPIHRYTDQRAAPARPPVSAASTPPSAPPHGALAPPDPITPAMQLILERAWAGQSFSRQTLVDEERLLSKAQWNAATAAWKAARVLVEPEQGGAFTLAPGVACTQDARDRLARYGKD